VRRLLAGVWAVAFSLGTAASQESKTYTLPAPKARITVVHAGAGWCEGYQQMLPAWRKFEKKFKGRAQLVHLDVDQRDTPEFKKYGPTVDKVGEIPLTLWYHSNGKVLHKKVGLVTAAELSEWTEKEIKKSK
jgi:hypothetical protein